MHRILYACILGLIGAGIVHIAILFILPQYSERDAWSRLSALSELYEPVRLNDELPKITMADEPFLEAAACLFNLDDGALHLEGRGQVSFWSMSIYDRQGMNVFNLTDRATQTGTLDIVVLTEPQMLRVRRQMPQEFSKSVFVETSTEEGIALLRVFQPDETWRNVVSAFFDQMNCRPRPL